MNSSDHKLLILWSYLAELILSSFFYLVILLVWDLDTVADFFIKISDTLSSKFTAIMLAGSIAFFWTFYSHSNTDFAKWLYHKNAFNVYLRAFLTAITVFLLATIACSLTQVTQNKIIALISGGLLILSLINVYSFLKNLDKYGYIYGYRKAKNERTNCKYYK